MKVYEGSQTTTAQATPDRVKVGIAEYQVTTDGTELTTSGLGSCIGVALWDREAGAAGLVHVMLPSAEGNEGAPAKFADTGVEVLVEAMEDAGATRDAMIAKIAGGSDMLDFSENGATIGSRNAQTVRDTLESFAIPIDGQDVGGDHGRSLRLEPRTGDLVIKSANQDANRI